MKKDNFSDNDFDIDEYIKNHSDDDIASFEQSSFDDFFGSDDGLILKPESNDVDLFASIDKAFGVSEKPTDEISVTESSSEAITADLSEAVEEFQETVDEEPVVSLDKTVDVETDTIEEPVTDAEQIEAEETPDVKKEPEKRAKVPRVFNIVSTLNGDADRTDKPKKKTKKGKKAIEEPDEAPDNTHPLFTPKGITDTLKDNYMPYAMSVIISRAIPEIDGFKPSHRKLLYTMYKMGLLNGGLTKSANIVGSTMKLNPHGDSAIYETMVRLARGNESLLHPFVESKGNFGKHYSRDMQCAASRYTEAKLAPISAELFKNIDKNNVKFVDNYDGTLKEPTLLPLTFPNILITPSIGIAVGMASSVCSFNLAEVCRTTIEYIKNTEHDLMLTLKAPDFSTGGQIIVDPDEMRSIYDTGRGSFKIRAKYRYDKDYNRIEIYEIPYTTTIEAIIDKIIALIKEGKIKEISEIRDETDKQGLRIAIELKRGNDAEKLMQKLFAMTPLEDSFGCNFNILVRGTPKVMGIKEILDEWLIFRVDCIKNELNYDLVKMRDKLHLLYGLKKIILDIDKAIKIVRETEDDAEVVPNLIIGFGIDEKQAEYVADIKLRNLNKQYLLNRIDEVTELEKSISDTESTLNSKAKIKTLIIKELEAVIKKYGASRRSDIIYKEDIKAFVEEDTVEDYSVNLFFTKSGYFKKITPLSLRMGSEQKLKEDDEITISCEASNKAELLFFTDKCQVYKSKVSDFAECKASVLGHFIPSVLGFENGENCLFMAVTNDYKGFILIFFKNGKGARISLECYETKTNRKKLINAFSDKSEAVAFFALKEDYDIVLRASNDRFLSVNSAMIAEKTTKNTQGVQVMTLKGKNYVVSAKLLEPSDFTNPHRYKTKNIPAAGSFLSDDDKKKNQLTL